MLARSTSTQLSPLIVSTMGDGVKLGLWGGHGGRAWEWKGTIEKILVKHGVVVDSLTFGYARGGVTVWSEKFGGDGGNLTEVSIKGPNEYLVTIKGTAGPYRRHPDQLITSITFVTNKCSYGPYGKECGNPFSLPVTAGKIGGFFGRCGPFLDAIGCTFVSHVSSTSCATEQSGTGVMVGEWGGNGGKPWRWDGPIEDILIRHGTVVDSISFGSTKNGATIWSAKFGGDGGQPGHVISIRDPEEYLVTITGTTGTHGRPTVITSIVFISNKRSYGPYGKGGGCHFYMPVQCGKISGFYGRAGRLLDAIGIKMAPLPPSNGSGPPPNEGGDMHVVGPWGGQGGREWHWDGPTHKAIVMYGSVVDSIQLGFMTEGGGTAWSEKLGGDGGRASEEIPIKLAEEYVVAIKGTTGLRRQNNSLVITSLTFVTNKRTYGPYGKETADEFSYSLEGGYISGFRGRCSQFLDAIGFSIVSKGLPAFTSPI